MGRDEYSSDSYVAHAGYVDASGHVYASGAAAAPRRDYGNDAGSFSNGLENSQSFRSGNAPTSRHHLKAPQPNSHHRQQQQQQQEGESQGSRQFKLNAPQVFDDDNVGDTMGVGRRPVAGHHGVAAAPSAVATHANYPPHHHHHHSNRHYDESETVAVATIQHYPTHDESVYGRHHGSHQGSGNRHHHSHQPSDNESYNSNSRTSTKNTSRYSRSSSSRGRNSARRTEDEDNMGDNESRNGNDGRTQPRQERDLEKSLSGSLAADDTPIVVATRASKKQKSEDSCGGESCLFRHKYKILGMIILLLVASIGVVVAALFVGGGGSDANGSGSSGSSSGELVLSDYYAQVGGNLDGVRRYSQHGLSVSMNEDGTRFAIANVDSVEVMQFQPQADGTMVAVRLGDEIYDNDGNIGINGQPSTESLSFRSPVITKMSANGEFVAIGYPLSNVVSQDDPATTLPQAGKVKVYQLQGSFWVQVGNTIEGSRANGFFGASLSLSKEGGIVAVGAPGLPGQGGYAQVYYLNLGTWASRGSSVSGEDLDLSVYSVSLSGEGQSIVVAGIPSVDGGSVAKVFSWVAGDWIEQGSGIGRTIGDTSYLAEISNDGRVIVVSNFYVTDADTNTGVGLDVRGYAWSDVQNDWEQIGENMHEGFLAPKSGYFISLSSDGRRIGMGDPGRRSGSSAATGHAHVYEYSDELKDWVQIGPNIWGEASGDQFGFSVAISGDGNRLVVGSPYNRGTGYEKGRVVAYDVL